MVIMGRLVLFFILALCYDAVELVRVQIDQGWLEGQLRPLSTGHGEVYSFKGIPYAEAPVGKLRFKDQLHITKWNIYSAKIYGTADFFRDVGVGSLVKVFQDPRPARGWEGTLNATTHGQICLQFNIFTNQYLSGSEDCLFVNVYTPALRPEYPLPVLFFIHGGGWKSGSGNDDLYGPDYIVNHGVILVTINYRLDALGFLSLDSEEVPGNAGMKDQVHALKWVRDNIRHFGGDPEQVNIMGHNAGGASVIYHMMSPMSRGLFKRAISMSGVPLCDWAQPFRAKERAFSLGKILGFNSNDTHELLHFLQRVPVNDLINSHPRVISQEITWMDPLKMFAFVPVVEKNIGRERFLIESPKEVLYNKNIRDNDLLIGYSSQEYLVEKPILDKNDFFEKYNLYLDLIVPLEILREIPPRDLLPLSKKIRRDYFRDRVISNHTMFQFKTLLNDVLYVNSVNRFLKYLPYGRSNTYFYKFYPIANQHHHKERRRGRKRLTQTDDLRYLFDAKSASRPVDIHSEEYRIIRQTSKLFTNFVKYGNPTPDDSLGAIWPRFEKERMTFLAIDDTITPGHNPDAAVVDYWHYIYDIYGIWLP